MSDPWVIITADVNVNSTEQGWKGIIYNPNDYKGTSMPIIGMTTLIMCGVRERA